MFKIVVGLQLTYTGTLSPSCKPV